MGQVADIRTSSQAHYARCAIGCFVVRVRVSCVVDQVAAYFARSTTFHRVMEGGVALVDQKPAKWADMAGPCGGCLVQIRDGLGQRGECLSERRVGIIRSRNSPHTLCSR